MSDSSQAELDVLADGREVLERWCASPRYRYLYPEGPNLALLLEAYQELDRRRLLERVRDRPRSIRRALRRLVRQRARADVLARHRRLRWGYPAPRLRPLHVRPALVRRALGRVDPDARHLVEARLDGRWDPDPGTTLVTEGIKERRGLDQFREALVNEALAHPQSLVSLHPQFLRFAASPPPLVRRYPVAGFLLVTLPLRLMAGVLLLLTTLYVGAYALFNDERLGAFVSDNVSDMLEGELRMERIHWELPLIVDLITGSPSHVVVEDVTVWEAYHSYGAQRTRPTAYVRRLEGGLTLHEIIPWNRLGVPEAIEIPWVLHFSEIHSEDEAWFIVREYDDTTDQGERRTLLSLLDAFTGVEPSDPTERALSFLVDDATLDRLDLDVDFMHGGEGWQTVTALRDIEFDLRFDAPTVDAGTPLELPFHFAVRGHALRGSFALDDIEIPLSDFAIEQLACGMDHAPLGDVRFAGEGLAAGSPLSLIGVLQDAFSRAPRPGLEPLPLGTEVEYGNVSRVELSASSVDPHDLAAHIERELELAHGTLVADDTVLWADIEGPLGEPRYHLAAEGLSLDLLGDPAWTMDDVRVSVDLGLGPVPDRWRRRVPPDARRLVARFDTFEGAALDGHFALDPAADEPAWVVFPEGDEPYLIAAPMRLDAIDPGRLSPDDPEFGATLAGRASGRLDLRDLELGLLPPELGPEPNPDAFGLRRAELTFDQLQLLRDRGPAADGMPRRIRADGTVTIGPDGGFDLEGLSLRTDGTELTATGGIDGEFEQLEHTLLRLRINDGRAFARAFGLPPYFDTLDAGLSVYGPATRPSGRDGSLRLAGVGVQGGKETTARMSMSDGVLSVYAPGAHLFGGSGSVDADITLFRGGRPLSDPPLRATVELRGVELAALGADAGLSGQADVRLRIGDENGNAVPMSRLEVRAEATIPELRFGGTRYRDAEVRFSLGPDRVVIDELVLPVHRAISPFHDDTVTIPIGKVVARGSFGLSNDPELDLEVEAEGVPLRLVARLLELDVPVRGRIGSGTRIAVRGSLRRPSVAGRVELAGLSTEGISLGSGTLEVTSEDQPAAGPLAAHRELRISGELSAPGPADGGIQWTLDGLVALGESASPGRSHSEAASFPPVDAEIDVRFDRISIDTLLAGLSNPPVDVTGRLDRLSAHVLTCDPAASMLTACVGESRPERSLAVSLRMNEAWIGGREPTTRDPCQDPTVLCAPEEFVSDQGVVIDNQLQASIDWPMITLDRPWRWTTGADDPAELVLSGNLDLSSPDPEGVPQGSPPPDNCDPPPLDTLPTTTAVTTMARAEVHGALDMAVIAELLGSEALGRARGRLDIDLALHGPAANAALSGRITLPESVAQGQSPGLTLDLDELGLPVEVSELDLRIADHWLAAHGQVKVLGDVLRFGSVGPSDHTGFAFGGTCEGQWGVAAEGGVSSRIINALAGEGTAIKGSVAIPRLVARGDVESEDPLSRVDGALRFGRTALTLDLDPGLPGVELVDGEVDFIRCGDGRCPTDVADDSIALYVGGAAGARAGPRERPSDALRAKIGPRGNAFAWGTAYLAGDLRGVDDTRLVVELEDVPYREYDQRGRSVYEAELSSPAVTMLGGVPLVVSGQIEVDRARYLKDAVQGVEILRFTDDVDLPSAPPPELIRNLQFDLRVETRSPLRVENNVAHGVEAAAVIDVAGTFDSPEFTGRVDVEPGGTVDIPFLTGTYEIQRGRVTLLRDLADAEVDVLALRQEQVYIDNQARQVYLQLGGTADAITWKCIADGDTNGAVATKSGCLDYLVLGAGDVQSSPTVQRTGGGGLANARKPLQVVGHVTEFDVGRRIEDTVPRLEPYVPNMRLRLGQLGPELEIATPQEWLDFDYAHGTAALDYTRGYPGFLLRQSQELTFKLEAIDLLVFEVSRDIRSYLNNRIIFDPLRQVTVEFRVDFEIPSLR